MKKSQTLISALLASGLFAGSAFAEIEVSDSQVFSDSTVKNETYVIKDGGTLSTSQNTVLEKVSITVEQGGTLQLNNQITNKSGTAGQVFDIYGALSCGTNSGSNQTFITGDNADDLTTIYFREGSSLASPNGGRVNLEMRRGSTSVYVEKTALNSFQDIIMGNRGDVGSINNTNLFSVNGGSVNVAAQTQLGSESAYIPNAGITQKNTLSITNAGVFKTRDLKVSVNSAADKGKYESFVNVEGAGSTLQATSFIRLGSETGVSTAEMVVKSGAKVITPTLSLYKTGSISLVLDSSNFDVANSAMIDATTFDYSDASAGKILIDGELLAAVNDFAKGDVWDIVLIKAGGINLDGVATSEFSYETIAGMFSFANNTGNENCADFGAENISFENGNFVLSLTYVPEPSAYAAIFGALALAFVAYRRRK